MRRYCISSSLFFLFYSSPSSDLCLLFCFFSLSLYELGSPRVGITMCGGGVQTEVLQDLVALRGVELRVVSVRHAALL